MAVEEGGKKSINPERQASERLPLCGQLSVLVDSISIALLGRLGRKQKRWVALRKFEEPKIGEVPVFRRLERP